MIFGGVKMVMVGVLVAAIAGAGIYVMKLQRDNAILKENQIKLEASVESQKKVIAQQAEDFGKILAANEKMNNLVAINSFDGTSNIMIINNFDYNRDSLNFKPITNFKNGTVIIGKYLAIELGVVVGDKINIMSSNSISTPTVILNLGTLS